MKKIKIIFENLLIGGITFLLFYLLGAFYNTSFNVKEWELGSRFLVVLFGAVSSILSIAINKLER